MKTIERADGLVVIDAQRRLYIGLSRDGTYWHVIQAASDATAKALEYTSDEGLTVRPVEPGQLICTCAGGRFHHHCYRTAQALQFEQEREAGLAKLATAAELDWGLDPVEASR